MSNQSEMLQAHRYNRPHRKCGHKLYDLPSLEACGKLFGGSLCPPGRYGYRSSLYMSICQHFECCIRRAYGNLCYGFSLQLSDGNHLWFIITIFPAAKEILRGSHGTIGQWGLV